MENINEKYVTADEARAITEAGKIAKKREKSKFFSASENEFENAVREFTAKCLERYIPNAAKNGDNHEIIVPAHYTTADDDQNRINRAKEIIEEMVVPYGYTVSWFCGSTMIAINW